MFRKIRQKLLNPVLWQLDAMQAKLDRIASVLEPQGAQMTIEKDTNNSVDATDLPSGQAVEMEPLLHDFNHYLHELRGIELSRMPKGAKVLLSAGCSGTWYFDWIENEYGKVDKHIGIEYYSPKPDDLPDYVEWISDTVGDMKRVADGSVDMVFSGQNIEHLNLDDLVGFIIESHRVLRNDGWLILDSPNRLITGPLKWLQPDHIAEFTVSEMEEILQVGGFKVINKKGILLMRENVGSSPWSINMAEYQWKDSSGWLRRAINACNKPDDSFVWWVEAQKCTDIINEEQVSAVCERILTMARNERVAREQ